MVKGMKPITTEILRMCHGLDSLSMDDVSVWAAWLLDFYGFLCQSNLFPPLLDGFKLGTHLSKDNISLSPNQASVTLPWSKSNQCKQWVVEVSLLTM